MLKGINDTLEDAKRLGNMLQGVHCAVNLIMYNSHEGAPFKAADAKAVLQFRDTVRTHGKLCTIRESKVSVAAIPARDLNRCTALVMMAVNILRRLYIQGDDEMAACGQLGSVDRQRIPVNVVPTVHSP